MNQGPHGAGEHCRISFANFAAQLSFVDGLLQNSKSALSGPGGIAIGIERSGKHHLKMRAMAVRKLNISDAHRSKLRPDVGGGGLSGGFQMIAEFNEPRLGDGFEERGFVDEMAVSRRSGNSGAAADLAQRQSTNSFFFNQLQATLEQDCTQISVMIGWFRLLRRHLIVSCQKSVDSVNIQS